MIRNVLIVDDDRIWLRVLVKKMAKYRRDFEATPAGDGREALEVLKSKPISLVVTDMQMPQMDGLTLLAHMSEMYPEIPVIVVTAYSTPKLKRAVLERGGAGYIEKPFVVENLARKVIGMLKKESEGGILQTVPLDMFIQLIEMEQKTCTIRVFNKATSQGGVLFFRDGDLLDARFQDENGLPAAYTIFSWEEVSLAIQDTCPIEEKRIDKDLQAILMDAARVRDEEEYPELLTETEEEDGASPEPDSLPFAEAEAQPSVPAREELPRDADEEELERLEKRMRDEKGFVSIRRDGSWNPLMDAAEALSEVLDAGSLQVVFFSKVGSGDGFLRPGKKTTFVIDAAPKSSRDRLLDLLSSP